MNKKKKKKKHSIGIDILSYIVVPKYASRPKRYCSTKKKKKKKSCSIRILNNGIVVPSTCYKFKNIDVVTLVVLYNLYGVWL